MSNSGFSTAGYVAGLLVMYAVGYWHAVWRRARKDYRDTKAAVPGLRAAMWVAFWRLMRSGGVVVVGLVVAIVWLVSEADEARDVNRVPAGVPSKSVGPAEPR